MKTYHFTLILLIIFPKTIDLIGELYSPILPEFKKIANQDNKIIKTVSDTWKYGKIHIVGDSHSAWCYTSKPNENPWKNIPWPESLREFTYEEFSFPFKITSINTITINFSIHWILGRTMHRIGRDGIDLELYGIKNNDIVCFVFGGIDIGGLHVLRQYISGRKIDEIINTCVSNYFNAILDQQKKYNNIPIVIQAVLPYRSFPSKENINEFNQYFPDQSLVSFQIAITNTLNEKLQEYSQRNNFLFLNINHIYETEEKTLRPDLSDGFHHVHPKFNGAFKENLIMILLNNSTEKHFT